MRTPHVRRAVLAVVPFLLVLPAASALAQETTAVPPAPTPATETANEPTLSESLDALFAQPGLTADQVAARAAATSHDVAAQHAQAEAEAHTQDQAFVGWFPRLTVQGRYRHDNYFTPPQLGTLAALPPGTPAGIVPAGTPLIAYPFSFPIIENSYAFQATVAVPVSDYLLRTSQAYSAASHSASAARHTEEAARRGAALQARMAFYQWVRAKLAAVVAEQALSQAQGHLLDAQRAFNVGAASSADVARVQSQEANAELLVSQTAGGTVVAEEQLRTLTHDASHDPYRIGEDVREDLPPVAGAADLDALFREALDARPELQALGQTASALSDQTDVARAAAYPRLDAYADVLVANPNQRYFPPSQDTNTTWDVGLALTWSPNDLGAALAASSSLDSRHEALVEQRAALRDRLRSEVVSAWQALRDAETAARTTTVGLTAAEESYRVRRALYRNGRATSVELTDAEVDLTRARLAALDARVALRIARAALLHAVGRDAIR